MKTLIVVLAFFSGILFWPDPACAGFDGYPEVPVLVQNSDAICVVKVIAITQIVPTQFEAVHKGRSGLPIYVDAKSAVAEVLVENVLKGGISRKKLEVTFFKNVYHDMNPTPFTELATGERDIVFLKATVAESRFALSQPSSHGKSKISIGETKIDSIPKIVSPLRAVLLVLVNAIESGSEPITQECLDRIGSIGYLLYAKAGVYSDEGAVTLRSKLAEPLISEGTSSSLENFVKDHVLPSVIKLTTSKDNDVCEQAFLAAGHLQDVNVIPELARLSDKNSDAASAIGNYRVVEAVKPLILALNSKNSYVKQEVADALRNFADPLAIPFLLDHLDDPDSPDDPFPGEQYYVVTALFTATNMPHYPGTVLFHDQASEYVQFWKKWAVDHSDRVKALRAQFGSGLASPVATP